MNLFNHKATTPDTWQTKYKVDTRQWHTAIWTGTEMIAWGGFDGVLTNTGGRYYPSNDSFLSTNVTNAPTARDKYTAVFTGTSMIIWGGEANGVVNNSLGIYNPYSSYDISGNLNGLNGNQVILQNNNGDDLTLTTDGSFIFDTAIKEGDSNSVTVSTNPTTPNQNCIVTNDSGMNIMANVSNVAVA